MNRDTGGHTATRRIDYDRIAPSYDQRFAFSPMERVVAALQALAQDLGASRILEVGCGTGRYLADLCPDTDRCCGLDTSMGMLHQAHERSSRLHLVRGRACQIGFVDAVFNLVYCVNAIHHFDDPRAFIGEAHRVLEPDGVLAVMGSNPHDPADRWYVYDYFEGTIQTDLERFPSWGTVVDWMIAAGFQVVEWRLIQRIVDHKVGREVLDDPFLQKSACSQLALLSNDAYTAGLRRIEGAVEEAAMRGETVLFPVDLRIGAIIARHRSRDYGIGTRS